MDDWDVFEIAARAKERRRKQARKRRALDWFLDNVTAILALIVSIIALIVSILK